MTQSKQREARLRPLLPNNFNDLLIFLFVSSCYFYCCNVTAFSRFLDRKRNEFLRNLLQASQQHPMPTICDTLPWRLKGHQILPTNEESSSWSYSYR
mmetsp:Transcript_13936/g.19953  ORF Transcript_13936/g.19953 Transcript_13936/m.19953 type:complete len:97 (-) Transcript_13936:574-864(-)